MELSVQTWIIMLLLDKQKRVEVEKEVMLIDNAIAVAESQARADAFVITQAAEADAAYLIEKGRFDGLKYLYQELGLTGVDAQTQEYKASLDYLRTLLKHDDVNLHVNYNTKIATFDD